MFRHLRRREKNISMETSKGRDVPSLDKYISSSVKCPVCGHLYGSDVISEHANSCLNSISPNDKTRDRKRAKPEWDFLSSSSSRNSGKVAKLSQSISKAKAGNARINTSSSTASSKNDESKKCSIEIIDCDEFSAERETVENHSNGKSKNKDKVHTGGGIQLCIIPNSNITPVKKSSPANHVPLAERVRPQTFRDFVGQEQAVGRNSILYTLITRTTNVPSMILWGPPGCGKTTLAKIIAQKCKEQGSTKFITMSATSASVNDVKETAKIAKNDQKMFRRKTILFLDEIHRFNKTQQDVLLPHVEDGTIILIGATTENPSFYVNGALLSRCRVITLEKLTTEDIKAIIKHALPYLGVIYCEDDGGCMKQQVVEADERCNREVAGSQERIIMEPSALDALAGLVDGDARAALNGLQMAVEGSLAAQEHQQTESGGGAGTEVCITVDVVKEALQRSHVLYDKTGEEHYNLISAMIKSLRGSEASAALYWMTRILEGGEKPQFVARRLVIFASEDIGLADSGALNLAVSTHQACQVIGMPECALNLAHCIIYLARAPKSNTVLTALQAAKNCVKNHEGALPPVPLHLRNAPTQLMKSLGYAKGYKYPHDFTGPVEQEYFPESLLGTDFLSS